MGEQFQRRYWNPHWIRVAEEDEAMKIGPWVARKRKALGLAAELPSNFARGLSGRADSGSRYWVLRVG